MSEENHERTNAKEKQLYDMDKNQEQTEQTPRPAANADETAGETGSVAGQIESDLEKLQRQLDESDNLMNSYKDQLLRLAAEFENFRKRTDAEKTEFVKYSNEKIIRDLLPVIDDFERALSNGKKNSDFDSFYKGVEMIYQKLQKIFEEKGVMPIDSIGKEFDVTYHDVLMQVQRPDVPPHTIVEEIERGYTLHGKVIKHAKVIVSADHNDEKNSAASD